MFGATLVIPAQICNELSCRQVVWGKTDGQRDRLTDMRAQRQYFISLKSHEVKINQWFYNRIWSLSPMACEKHCPWASVTTKMTVRTPWTHEDYPLNQKGWLPSPALRDWNQTQILQQPPTNIYDYTKFVGVLMTNSHYLVCTLALGLQWCSFRIDMVKKSQIHQFFFIYVIRRHTATTSHELE